MIPKCYTSSGNPEKTSVSSDKEKSIQRENNTLSATHIIQKLQSRLNNLHQLLTKPHIINLHGFEHLQLKSVSHNIKQSVDILFFEAHIPNNWKVKVKWTYSSTMKIIVSITLLNYIVKEKVKEMLLTHLEHNYNSTIYTD